MLLHDAMIPRLLIDRLEDPFEMFPVQGVISQLAASLAHSEEALYANMGPWGVSRKYWNVEEEHWQERVGLLIGAAFVLSQAVMTQSVSIVLRLGRETKVAGIPESRDAILSWKAEAHEETGVSKLLIVDAAANSFKHHYEWPEDWDATKGTRAQQRTIAYCADSSWAPATSRTTCTHLCAL
jgi:hypothetical protein